MNLPQVAAFGHGSRLRDFAALRLCVKAASRKDAKAQRQQDRYGFFSAALFKGSNRS